MSLPLPLPEPPTTASIADARVLLRESQSSAALLTSKIANAEQALQQIVLEARRAIDEMVKEKEELEAQTRQVQSYLAPVRRLPLELLREVFYWCFEDHPCSAWVLASVCKTWRRLSLAIPRIWSKIRLVTTQHSSADTIRLWLERSGHNTPLDIEIFLRVTKSFPEPLSPSYRYRRHSSSPPATLYYPFPTYHTTLGSITTPGATSITVQATPAYVPPGPPVPGGLPPATTPIVVPLAPNHHPSHDIWGHSPTSSPAYMDRLAAKAERQANANSASKASTHWGYIAIFYLVEQMHRWERFVFRFEKQFASISALRSIVGNAPLLKEFEVSAAESSFYPEWPWLPNMSPPNSKPELPNLRSLTLQFTPFKWSSPMFQSPLHTLYLRALPASHLPLDRILHMLHASKDTLQSLSMHFQTVTAPILPLSTLTLPELKELSLGGHSLLTQVADNLLLPSLEELNLDIEARDPIEDVILSLIARSGGPAVTIKHLSVSYGFGSGRRATEANKGLLTSGPIKPSPGTSTAAMHPVNLYYGSGGVILSWTVLSDLPHLESLRVGGTPMDSLLGALGFPEDDVMNGGLPMTVVNGVPQPQQPNGAGAASSIGWMCPNLVELRMKNCPGHTEGVVKLVQMVDVRNPDPNGTGSFGGGGGAVVINGVAPKRIKVLEIQECVNVGQDVLDWLNRRVEEVVCIEPVYERSPYHGHSFVTA